MPLLRYVYDPLCGWCYAAAPLIAAAAERTDVWIRLHGGGLLTGDQRRVVSPAWRDFVLPHDQRIAALSGQPFGTAYTDGLLCAEGTLLDSAPPISAVMAAEIVGQRGLAMLERLQRAHFVEGLVVSDASVLEALADELGLHALGFVDTWTLLEGDATRSHMGDARRLMSSVGGDGFPTLALELDDGTRSRIDLAPWLGRVDAWRAHLDALLTQPD